MGSRGGLRFCQRLQQRDMYISVDVQCCPDVHLQRTRGGHLHCNGVWYNLGGRSLMGFPAGSFNGLSYCMGPVATYSTTATFNASNGTAAYRHDLCHPITGQCYVCCGAVLSGCSATASWSNCN